MIATVQNFPGTRLAKRQKLRHSSVTIAATVVMHRALIGAFPGWTRIGVAAPWNAPIRAFAFQGLTVRERRGRVESRAEPLGWRVLAKCDRPAGVPSRGLNDRKVWRCESTTPRLRCCGSGEPQGLLC